MRKTVASFVAGLLCLIAASHAGAERRGTRALREDFRRDLVRDREAHPTDRLNRPDARTVQVKVSPLVSNGKQGVLATARRQSGAVIGRAAEIDAKMGAIVRFIGNWGFVGRFAAPPGKKRAP